LVLPFIVAVENACLLHDLGNPPFGHLGEYAIQSWFAKNEGKVCKRWRNHGLASREVDSYFSGFKYFDGNPQTLRIVTRLQWWKDAFGLNLTTGLLGSIVKYLARAPSDGPFCKKPGYFETERTRVLEIWKQLGLKHNDERPLQRHPLVFIMEAADDIGYCLSDIEDALEKGIVSEALLYEALDLKLKTFWTDQPPEAAGNAGEGTAKFAKFLTFKVNVTRWLVKTAAELFHRNHTEILSGELHAELLSLDGDASRATKLLKDFTRRHIQRSREAIHVELTGFRIVTDLLDFFGNLVFAGQREFERLLPDSPRPPMSGEMPLEQRMFALLPQRHRLAYRHLTVEQPTLEPVFRAHLIVDYVTGMTDTHALKVFKMLRGFPPGG
jgi:dGTPase